MPRQLLFCINIPELEHFLPILFSHLIFPFYIPILYSYFIFSHFIFPFYFPILFTYFIFLFYFPILFSHFISPFYFPHLSSSTKCRHCISHRHHSLPTFLTPLLSPFLSFFSILFLSFSLCTPFLLFSHFR